MSEYEVFSGPYFPVLGLNTGKNGPENTSYLDTFHIVLGHHDRLTHKHYFKRCNRKELVATKRSKF